ncbi:MAG: hypothetical protein BJ554DRAFT_5484 [Olpidium bornovanus]|uniref:Condensin-2 complex subunit H2 C-terminal domain-containing protein n=1 Tax=Olpidium bornovanus TaxID=278681 RepID=A0A8H8DL05_9FUNG|nr:MAG: hypothetical protein BJ554DRAFT_5484 [Olpidium bornovanus]
MPKIKKEEEEGESADVVPVTKFLKRMGTTLYDVAAGRADGIVAEASTSARTERRPAAIAYPPACLSTEFDYVFFAEEKLRLAAEQEVCASTRSPAAVGDGDWDRLDVTSPWDFPPVKTCEVPAGDEAVVATVPPEGAFDEFEAGWDDPVGFESDNHRIFVARRIGKAFWSGDITGHFFKILSQAPAQPPRLHESGVEGVVPETYEDLCKLRIDSYLLNAERFETEVESTLAKRVKRWEMRLKPILEEQERRAFLDVGMYGNRVVGTLVTNETAEANVVVPFADLVKNVDRCEVPRFFLATLHLANARNVDIVSSAADGLGVKLLDRNVRRLEA